MCALLMRSDSNFGNLGMEMLHQLFLKQPKLEHLALNMR